MPLRDGQPIPPKGRALRSTPAQIEEAATIDVGDIARARDAWRLDARGDRLIDIVDATKKATS